MFELQRVYNEGIYQIIDRASSLYDPIPANKQE